MPYVLIGDAAYPLLNWLINEYRIEQTPEQVSFNLYLHKARIVVEHAFGRLKARWRILCKRSELDVYFMPEVILACCILHNFVEIMKDPFVERWMNDVQNEDLQFPQPDREFVRGDENGAEVRERMRTYLELHYPLLMRG